MLDLATDSAAQAFYKSTWPAIQRAAAAEGYSATKPEWWIDGNYPWHVTPEARLNGFHEAELSFYLTPLNDEGVPEWVMLEIQRNGHGMPWQLVTHHGFLRIGRRNEGSGDLVPQVVGTPALEVAIARLFPQTVDFLEDRRTAPPVHLTTDSAAYAELAAFLAPHDSAIRASIPVERLAAFGGNPYEWMGVGAVDSLDRSLGLREGVLRIQLIDPMTRRGDRMWFELDFVRTQANARWQLLDRPKEALTDPTRDDYHARVRRVEEHVRERFGPPVAMATWWALRRDRRGVVHRKAR